MTTNLSLAAFERLSTIPRVAVIHDWLTADGGAERVLEQILLLFPQADIFTLVQTLDAQDFPPLAGHKVTTSFVQRIPFGKTSYRSFLPLLPIAIEQFDLSGYDVIVSSSFSVAKGVLSGPDQFHASYVHSPMRYAWDLQHQYLQHDHMRNPLKQLFARYMLHKIRIWDVSTAPGVDYWIANSRFIRRRIRKTYGVDSDVIYPPVDVDRFQIPDNAPTDLGDFFVSVSRLVPYKRVDAIVDAFRELPAQRLVVIGDGPEASRIRDRAPSNVTFLGHAPTRDVIAHMQAAKALVFAAEEDFGIVPVEAQACGTPVIALNRGGTAETVVPGQTGVHFSRQTPDAIAQAVQTFLTIADEFSPQAMRDNAESYSATNFRTTLARALDAAKTRFDEERDIAVHAAPRSVVCDS